MIMIYQLLLWLPFINRIGPVLSMEMFGDVPRLYTVNQCSAQDRQMLSTSMLSVAPCKPRKVTVNLDEIMSHAAQVIPSHAVVNRCTGGGCTNANTCITTATRIVNVSAIVMTSDYDQGRPAYSCQTIQIQEDTSCHCGCQVRPEDCNPIHHQVYSWEHCQCRCNNHQDWLDCDQRNLEWDSRTCSCRCPSSPPIFCSTGYMLNPVSCQCEPKFGRAGLHAIVLGAVAVLSLIGTVIFYLVLRKKRNDSINRRESLARVLEFESN